MAVNINTKVVGFSKVAIREQRLGILLPPVIFIFSVLQNACSISAILLLALMEEYTEFWTIVSSMNYLDEAKMLNKLQPLVLECEKNLWGHSRVGWCW
jgi:hypothetical protein